jgi:pimeloyl-ACP methyl ester carboxylesterase
MDSYDMFIHALPTDDGLSLAADLVPGDTRRPPVLLAHGFGQTRQSWSGTQRRLAEAGHASLAFDMRGHGASRRNPAGQPYAADQFVADVHTAADALGGHPILVGASMGGLTGLLAQAQRPRFAALVLVDVTPQWESTGAERIQRFMGAHPDGFADYDAAADAIAAYMPHRRERKRPEQLRHLLHPRDGRLHWHWDPRLLSEFMQSSDALQAEVARAAARIDVPVLLISGGRSDLVSDRTVDAFLALVPHARHERLPDATHMVAGDDNDAFADVLLRHLGAQFPDKLALAPAPHQLAQAPASLSPAPAPGHGDSK